jgi:hypothetical protein
VNPPTLTPIDAPFDQYQRYRLTSDLVQALETSSGSPISVLDVGGSHIDFWGRPHRPVAEFLPGRSTITLDVTPNPLRGYLRGRGDALPFRDRAFDVVSSVDVLEHVPPAARPGVIGQLTRVASRAVILAAPFASPAVDRAEALVSDFIERACGYVQGQLREHRELGWPDLRATVAEIEAAGWTARVFGYGSVWRWMLMMVDKHAVQAIAGSRPLQVRLDRAYNEQSFADDRARPCYRHFVVAVPRADDPVLAWASAQLGAAPVDELLQLPDAPAEAVDAMFDLLAVHARNQELQIRLEPERRDAHIVDVEAHRQQAFVVLAAVEAENARLGALLRSVEQSPAFKLASWMRRLLGR